MITHGRLPDSETSGLTLVSSSPELFAAVHVLLRLLAPRHPPRALRSLTVSLRHASSPLCDRFKKSDAHLCDRFSADSPRLSRTGFEPRARTLLLSFPATLDDAFIVWTAFSFLFDCQRAREVTCGVNPRDCIRSSGPRPQSPVLTCAAGALGIFGGVELTGFEPVTPACAGALQLSQPF